MGTVIFGWGRAVYRAHIPSLALSRFPPLVLKRSLGRAARAARLPERAWAQTPASDCCCHCWQLQHNGAESCMILGYSVPPSLTKANINAPFCASFHPRFSVRGGQSNQGPLSSLFSPLSNMECTTQRAPSGGVGDPTEAVTNIPIIHQPSSFARALLCSLLLVGYFFCLLE